MKPQEALHSLLVFDTNAKELAGSSFIRWMKLHQGTSMHLDVEKKDVLPRYESVKAFILTFRVFIQKKDPSSLENIALLYSQGYIPKKLNNDFKLIFGNYSEHLNRSIGIAIYKDEERKQVLETKKELRDMFIYGKLAHNDRNWFYMSKTLLRDRWFRLQLWPEFLLDLFVCNNLIQSIHKVNKKTLKILNQTTQLKDDFYLGCFY